MILFVKVSKLRYMVIDAPTQPTGWHLGTRTAGEGFTHATGKLIAGPVDWGLAVLNATQHAADNGDLLTAEEWHAMREARA
jgi:hypothetical protein